MYDKYYFFDADDSAVLLIDTELFKIRRVSPQHLELFVNPELLCDTSALYSQLMRSLRKDRYVNVGDLYSILVTNGGSAVHFDLGGYYIRLEINVKDRGAVEFSMGNRLIGEVGYYVKPDLSKLNHLKFESKSNCVTFKVANVFEVRINAEGELSVVVHEQNGMSVRSNKYLPSDFPRTTMNFKREASKQKLMGVF